MIQPAKNLFKICTALCLGQAVMTTALMPANAKELSLLKSEQSMRSQFLDQPNLEKGEFAVPMQASIIYVMKQPLTDFLYQVTARNNVKLTISETVSGELEKISLPMELELILPELSKSYGVQWHFQNRDLFISSSLENENRIIKLDGMNKAQFQAELKRAGVKPGSNRLQFNEEQDTLLIVGSKQFIRTVEKIIKTAKPV